MQFSRTSSPSWIRAQLMACVLRGWQLMSNVFAVRPQLVPSVLAVRLQLVMASLCTRKRSIDFVAGITTRHQLVSLRLHAIGIELGLLKSSTFSSCCRSSFSLAVATPKNEEVAYHEGGYSSDGDADTDAGFVSQCEAVRGRQWGRRGRIQGCRLCSR